MSTLSHIYVDWGILVSQVAYVLLVDFFSMWFFLYCDNICYFLLGKTGCPILGNFFWGKLLILFLYIWLRKTGGFILGVLFWLINTGSVLEILSWIKIDMPDIINCDIWIRTCSLENNWQGFSSVDTNFEASYQLQSIKKWKWLKTLIQ